MKEVNFKNKVWVSQKKMNIYKWLIIFCCIYLFLLLFVIMMEKITLLRGFQAFAMIVIILWARIRDKNAGAFVDADCKITFDEDSITWEYPDVPLQLNKPGAHIVYRFSPDDIKNIITTVNPESISIECTPVAENITTGKTVDYRKNNKSCILTAYDTEELEELFRQYTGKVITRY